MTQPTITHELSAPNVLLMGPAGTGKTHSIGTLVDTGIEVFYVDLENGLESLLGYWTDRGKPIPANLHWHKLAAPKTRFKDRRETANKINTMSYQTLTALIDPNRKSYDRFTKLWDLMCNFKDQRTGQDFGDVGDWGPDRAIVIDGLSGIGKAAQTMVVGGKPTMNQGEWGIAMNAVEEFIISLCDESNCWFVLISHVSRETDTVLGGVKIMLDTLGAKLAPKIPQKFSDVILTARKGTEWTWDTGSPTADVKTRNLPVSEKLSPTFLQIHKKWLTRATAAKGV